MLYICNRIQQNSVPWMSGLVTGLQNHARRFESARHLKKISPPVMGGDILFIDLCAAMDDWRAAYVYQPSS